MHFLTFPTLIFLILPFCPYIHYIYLEQRLQSQFVGCRRRLAASSTTKYISLPPTFSAICGSTLEVSSTRFTERYHPLAQSRGRISDPVGVIGNIGEISWWMTVWKFADVALFLLSSTAELDSLVMAGFSNYTFTNLKIIYQFPSSYHWNDVGDHWSATFFLDSLLSNYQWADSYNNPLYKSYLNAKLYKILMKPFSED